jgi:DNA-directed RNA polymerase subunit RPC12/RpoP
MDIKEYKCPNCSGAVKFDSGIQKMKCPYCDAEFEIAAVAEYQKQMAEPEKDNFEIDAGKAVSVWNENDLGDLSTGSCPSCGAELIGDKNTIATVCPCCGNTQIMQKRVQGLLKPEYVIPFQLDKKAAKDALLQLYKGKKLLPDFFKTENHVNNIQGLYVPFWLFDAKAQGHVSYKAAKVSGCWSDSSYNYTKTDYYSVQREGSLGFEKISVDGSEKMDDDYMDSIEPFDYGKLTDFQTAYLSGYLAEKYDVGIEASKERAVKRIKNTVESQFASSVTGYATVKKEQSSINVEDGKVIYSLFPVWVLNSKYKNESCQFIMNGQSGLIVGKLPIDKGKVFKYSMLYLFGFGAAFSLIIGLLQIFF